MTKKNYQKGIKLNSTIIIIIILDLILIGLTTAGIYFIPDQAKSIRQKRSQLLAQTVSTRNYQKTMADLEAVQADFKYIQQSLPDAESIVDFIELINKIDQETNLKMFTFNSDLPLQDEQGNKYLPLTLVIEDSPYKIISALNQLQKSNYLFQPSRFAVRGTNLEKDSVKTSFDLLIYVDSSFEKENEN